MALVYSRKSHKKLLFCLLSSFFIVLVVLVIMPPNYVTLDDYIQNIYVNGHYYEWTYLMPYTLGGGVSIPIANLYKVFPDVAWWPLYLLGNIGLSFSIVFFYIPQDISRITKAGLYSSLILCEILLIRYFTYTSIAFITVAGGLIILSNNIANSVTLRKFYEIISAFMIFNGISLRPEAGIAVICLFLPYFFGGIILKSKKNILRSLSIVICSLSGALALGNFLYLNTEGWHVGLSIICYT